MDNQNILLSVKPQYANLLVDGIKTIELRRKFPESLPKGMKCFIYATSPKKKVIGHCKIKEVKRMDLNALWLESSHSAMISWEDFSSYFQGLTHGYAIHLYGYTRYNSPIDLSSITGLNSRPPQSFRYVPEGAYIARA